MLDYLFSALVGMIEKALSSAVNFFLEAFNFSKETFLRVFPFAEISFPLFQGIALGLVLMIAVISAFHFFRGGKAQENPIGLVFRSIAAVLCIYMGNYFLEGIIGIASSTYNVLLGSDIDSSFIANDLQGFSLVVSILSSAFYNVSILLYMILLIMLGYQLIKVLLEAVERFVVLYVLLFISPPFFATIASRFTIQIFKQYINMFITQSILMLANVWFLKMALSVFASIGTIGNNISPIVPLIMAFSLMRIAQRFDNILNQLGLNGAITGCGLGADLIGSAVAIGGATRAAASSVFFGGGGGGAPGGVMGAAQKASSFYGRYSPTAHAANTVRNTASAAGSTILGAIRKGAGFASDAASSGASASEQTRSFWQGFQEEYDQSIGKNMSDAADATQEANAFADRAAGVAGAASGTEHLAAVVTDPNVQLTDDQNRSIRNRPRVASSVMGQMSRYPDLGLSIRDNEKNAAMLASFNIPESDAFIRAADGNLSNAGNFRSVTDSNGITAHYDTYSRTDENGQPVNPKTHSMRVVNQAMFDAMQPNERTGFTSFQTPNGDTAYVRYDGNDPITPPPAADPAPPPGPNGNPTKIPPTSVPPVSVPPTSIPPTSDPATSLPPKSVPQSPVFPDNETPPNVPRG